MPSLAAAIDPDRDVRLLAERMLRAVPARGNDIETVAVGGHALGLARDARLPHEGDISQADGWAAVMVGRIDNLDELSPGQGGAALRLARLVRAHGPEAAEKMRGIFAWVVTDGRSLWAARDHLGFETLFYTHSANRLLLASETSQLLDVSEHPREPDLELMEALLYSEPRDESRCSFLGVQRLPKRTVLTWNGAAIDTRIYWSPESLIESGDYSADEIPERFHQLMDDAARRALSGPTAILLSGGVDSPAVAAYAAPAHVDALGTRLGAVTATYPTHPTVDELSYVEAVATYLDLDLHPYPAARLRLHQLDEWVREFGGPWLYWHPGTAAESYQQAVDHGYRNILTGMHAEFVFDRRRSLLTHYLWTARWGHAAHLMTENRRRGSDLRQETREIIGAFVPRALLAARRRRIKPHYSVPPWIDHKRVAASEAARTPSPRRAWREAQLTVLEGAGVAAEADSMLQARLGVRVRHPWVDVDLWEFWLRMPAPLKFPRPGSKALVKDLLRGRVPDVILDRRNKTVFNDFMVDQVDFDSLEKWLLDPPHRLAGVDYPRLADHLARREMGVAEFLWAMQLATIHAFLAQW